MQQPAPGQRHRHARRACSAASSAGSISARRCAGASSSTTSSLIPLGLPGIVVAVALIQFWLRVPLPIYGTLADHPARLHRPLRARSACARPTPPSARSTRRWRRPRGSPAPAGCARSRASPCRWPGPGSSRAGCSSSSPRSRSCRASILLFSSGSITLAVAVYNLYETGALEPVAALAHRDHGHHHGGHRARHAPRPAGRASRRGEIAGVGAAVRPVVG